jgi:hypothetical protein
MTRPDGEDVVRGAPRSRMPGLTRLQVILAALVIAAGSARADEVAAAGLGELSSGKVKVFDVATSRFRGPTSFKISYPRSWGVGETQRPGVAARIASANGDGMDALVVVVNRGDPAWRDAAPDKVFTKDFFSKFGMTGATVVRSERLKDGAFDGAVIEYDLMQSRPPMKVRAHVTNYLFLQKGALVQLQFYILLGNEENKDADAARISAFRPLWRAMVQTLRLD